MTTKYPKLPRVGVDVLEVKRFKDILKTKKLHLLSKIFNKSEVEYCMAFKDPAPHLAGLFTAKEAVSKALGVAKYPFADIEIRHTKEGAPIAYYKGKKLRVSVSITHIKNMAIAVAIG